MQKEYAIHFYKKKLANYFVTFLLPASIVSMNALFNYMKLAIYEPPNQNSIKEEKRNASFSPLPSFTKISDHSNRIN